jgi:hypothetical protein
MNYLPSSPAWDWGRKEVCLVAAPDSHRKARVLTGNGIRMGEMVIEWRKLKLDCLINCLSLSRACARSLSRSLFLYLSLSRAVALSLFGIARSLALTSLSIALSLCHTPRQRAFTLM